MRADSRVSQGKRREHFLLVNAASLGAGLEYLKTHTPDVILLDLGLPDSQGLNTLDTVILDAPQIPVIVLTGLNNADLAVQAVHAGAQDYLAKGEFTSDFRYASSVMPLSASRRKTSCAKTRPT